MNRLRALIVLAAALSLALAAPAQAAPSKSKPKPKKTSPAGLRAPAVTGPKDSATTNTFPLMTWKPVGGAVKYQVQIAADKGFNPSLIDFQTLNKKYITPKQFANGLYFWRVRAWNVAGKSGRWSSIRKYTKKWTAQSTLQTPANLSAISYPTPVILRWSPVPGATSYAISLAAGSSLAGGSVDTTTGVLSAQDLYWKDGDKPVGTFNTNMAITIPLQPGTYYWQITPIDAEGFQGVPSAISAFTWDWPSTTKTYFEDLSAKPELVDPKFSWDPIAGAASYQIEVNTTSDFVPGSKVYETTTTASEISPTGLFQNNTYYWRVRALDTLGKAGLWNVGGRFDKSFDAVPQSIGNLRVRDSKGTIIADGGSVLYPVITWDSVPGAKSYELSTSCSADGSPNITQHYFVPNNSWTPLGDPGPTPPLHINSLNFGVRRDNPQPFNLTNTTNICFVIVRALSPDAGAAVYSINSYTTTFHLGSQPSFVDDPAVPAGGAPMSNADIRQPTIGTISGKAPLFCWKTKFYGVTPVPAYGYWVAVSRDANFTTIVDEAFTQIPCYAPRGTYADEETALYWEVLPWNGTDNILGLKFGFGDVGPTLPPVSPPSFNEHSTPPTQLTPTPGQVVTGNVTFRWSDAPVEYSGYSLQIARDTSFSDVVEEVGTQSTAYTSTTAYPPDTVLYWRVRVTNAEGIGLSWSPASTFVQTRATPVITTVEPFEGETFPAVQWTPVAGAIGYELQDVWPDASVHNAGKFLSTAASYVRMTGIGRGTTKVRAVFPGDVRGPYSPTRSVLHTIGEVTGANVNTKVGMSFAWQTKANTKQYKIQVASDVDFTQLVLDDVTDQTTYTPTLDQDGFKNGGRLYWRVAAIDPDNNLGAFTPAKPIVLAKRMDVKGDGTLAKGQSSVVTITVTDAKGQPIRKAEVRVTGAGATAKRKRTNGKGVVVMKVRVRKSGTVKFQASKAGFKVGYLFVTVA